MDRILARRLEKDADFRARMVKLTKDYLKLGRDSLAYWSNDFDTAYDTLMCYSPLAKKDLEALERSSPKRFILPLTATQITTMTTYISQVLFGQSTPHKVEGRRAQDEIPAEFVNQLLRWNAEQQDLYSLGYMWVQDALAVNRGVLYDSWAPIFRPTLTEETVIDPEAEVDPTTGQPGTYKRTRRIESAVGGYGKVYLVSPYDFVCDPTLPIWRLNEMRFAGHRTVIPVTELRRRSKLPPDHPEYVMPWAVKDLVEKAKKGVAQVDAAVPSLPGVMPNPAEIRMSRTAYERTRALQPTGQNQADKADTGDVECWELWVRLVPSDNGIYSDDKLTDDPSKTDINDGPALFQVLISGGDVILAMNEAPNLHGLFPYAVGEGRPNAHFQFSPSWILILKGIQDYVDWLKNRHQEALTRTIGNIFVYDPSMVDVSDFMNPEKEGLLISLRPEAAGKKISDVFEQVPIKDMTEGFLEEAMSFVKYSESVTAANSSMQGGGQDESGSATEYAGTQQMSAGRMTSIARLLSSSCLVPQTKRIVSNFQQFMDHEQEVRFVPSAGNLPPELQLAQSVKLNRDTIQGQFEFIAHDGTLPGTDAKKVAAISKILEIMPAMPQLFEPAPGNLDPRLLIMGAAKSAGLNVENFMYSAQSLTALANGGPGSVPAPGGPPGAPPPAPGAPALPTPPPDVAVTPPGQPGPAPALPTLPDLTLKLPGLDVPTRPKPANPVS